MDRYRDFAYLGAMARALIVSAAAALGSRLDSRAHERSGKLTERLLEILQAARAVDGDGELDEHERELGSLA